jgi:single-stranded-DNA-specific exonuclease
VGAIRARFNPETDRVIVEGQLLWHIGVIGIVASRVLQEFYRPTIIIAGEGDQWRGSGRSVEGFDLAAALRDCGDLLVRHGGHAMAAGMTIHPDKIDAFRARLNDLARRTLKPEQLQPLLRLDAEVAASELSLERLRELAQLEQTGIGNPPVHLVMRGVTMRAASAPGAEKKHAKLWLTDGNKVLEAVLWGAG